MKSSQIVLTFLIRFLRTGNLSKIYTQKPKSIYTIRYAYGMVRIYEQLTVNMNREICSASNIYQY